MDNNLGYRAGNFLPCGYSAFHFQDWVKIIMLRPWNFKLALHKNSNQAIYLQIAQQIIDEIQTGRLTPSAVMPGTRELAKTLNVNRKTTVLAYEELISQGWLATEKRRGTFVAKNLVGLSDFNAPLHSIETEERPDEPLSQDCGADHFKQSAWIDFTDGASDNRLVPLETFSRAFRKALVHATRYSHQPDIPQGSPALRSSIATMVNMEKNFRVDADRVCVVSSSQMAVFVIARVLTRADDCIVFERLSNPLARQAFESCGARIHYIDVDRYGADVDQIASLAAERKIRAVVVTPQQQFPTTVLMTQERRRELLRLAELHDFYIIEDDREHEFHFDDTPPFPIASIDGADRAIYLGSLSHVLAPALQLAYLIGDKSFIERCVTEKTLIDCQNKISLEFAVSELMESGEMQRHRRRISRVFAERREYMQSLLRDELGQQADFDLPKGGLAFWLRLPQTIDMKEFRRQTDKENVRFSPGSHYAEQGKEVPAIRLGFANLNKKELATGVKRIKRALMASLMSMMFVFYEPTLH